MADSIYVCDDGIKADLDSITGKAATPIGAGTLRLFTAPTTVSKATVFGGVTQATFTGYGGIALASATWSAASVTANVATSGYTGGLTFTKGAGAAQTIYGAYITDNANTKLYRIWLFASGPYVLTNPGDTITISITLSQKSEL